MTRMGRYCKAYEVTRFREFPGWAPRLENLARETEIVDGKAVEVTRSDLRDDDVLFLQESLIVTDGIALDEHVVFTDASPEWREFCDRILGFALPEYLEERLSDATTTGQQA